MSQQYPGGFMTKANVDPTSSLSSVPAPGVWTLDQALQYKQAGVWPSYVVNAIEDVFSTYLYTGNGTSQTITNGINLSGQGGLVWIKNRSSVYRHILFDTNRGSFRLDTSVPDAEVAQTFNYSSTGYTDNVGWSVGQNIASWTFRKQAKFFDVVTYTGNGSNQNIAHNLGSVPGFVVIKRTNTTGNWSVWHRSIGNNYLILNTTAIQQGTGNPARTVTSTTFEIYGNFPDEGANGSSYVMYLFAHDAGGFGPNSTDNVISCGSYTGDGNSNGPTINLGWEPQWVLIKRATGGTGNWRVFDNMRGINAGANSIPYLLANTSDAEVSAINISINATGFQTRVANADINTLSSTYIYIAIRRGPMRAPTTGTSVFGVNARTGTGANATVTGGQLDDAVLIKNRGSAVESLFSSRLTSTGYLVTSNSAAEVAAGTTILQANPWDVMDGAKVGTTSTITNAAGNTYINYLFRRAPGFFDVVCWTGTGSYPFTINHNLGVVPELMIFKSRSAIDNWYLYLQPLVSPNANWYQNYLVFSTNARLSDTTSFTTSPTNTTIPVASFYSGSGVTWIAYLFATLPGVSKVGSYTGTGALQTVNCGFTSGARFVLIKRTDATGDWWTYDSTRGIASGNDPYFFMNSSAAEVTNTNYVNTASVGFQVTAAAPAGLNASGGSYIFLAIA